MEQKETKDVSNHADNEPYSKDETAVFFKRKRPPPRLRGSGNAIECQSTSDNDDDEQDDLANSRDLLHKNKRRTVHGVSLENLNSSSIKLAPEAKTNMTAAEKQGLIDVQQLEKELALNNTFSAETNRRDEDAEMLKYIEEELERKRRERIKEKITTDTELRESDEPTSAISLSSHFKPGATIDAISDDVLLKSLPEHLLTATTDEKSEEMLSSQMLTGIPEVDLGVEERIRNIEATEEARLRLASNQSGRGHSSHTNRQAPGTNRFQSHQQSAIRSASQSHGQPQQPCKVIEEPTVQVGEEPVAVQFKQPVPVQERRPAKDRASDSFYLGRFKKNMGRK